MLVSAPELVKRERDLRLWGWLGGAPGGRAPISVRAAGGPGEIRAPGAMRTARPGPPSAGLDKNRTVTAGRARGPRAPWFAANPAQLLATITAPITITAVPTQAETGARSPRTNAASTRVTAPLNRSTGATRSASPTCNARK